MVWGFGGRYYWGRKGGGGGGGGERKVEGIVVAFSFVSSQESNLKNYVDLYSSIGWNSLVCHSDFLNLFSLEKATSLALELLNELIGELKVKPCPVVLASFSGGSKACMYRFLQIIEGRCGELLNLDEYRLVRDCICGHVYDSSPVDFTSDLGTRFIQNPSVLSRIIIGMASRLDTLFLSRIESQRSEYWQTLYSSVSLKAPYLILCSENDELAPCQIVVNFAGRLQELGGDVKLVKWTNSSHLGHFRHYPNDYAAVMTELFGKATIVYSQRIRQLEGMGFDALHNEVSGPFGSLRKAIINANQSFRRVALELDDHFLTPTSSMTYHDNKVVGSLPEARNEGVVPVCSQPQINAHGVLGQILFDVCVPENVEDWDIRSSPSLKMGSFVSSLKRPMKFIRRSRM
ncbi:uncharacterized protein LOC124927403 [Impatiens glandulifera]|uniref:uncharacterized protein LOC124927403 n=1 Tax=Impatiens glandulifera TaxID=253017 RepID=UPI001FB0E9FA|nr:uncharacterized protein LOC124927403 [Impatiens glandulifera]